MGVNNQVPHHVIYACYFAIASVAIGFISVPSYWADGVLRYGLLGQVLLIALPGLFFVSLYYLAYKRKNWARIFILILLGLSFPGYVLSLFGPGVLIFKTTQVFQLIFFVASFSMLLTKPSRLWYRSVTDV